MYRICRVEKSTPPRFPDVRAFTSPPGVPSPSPQEAPEENAISAMP